MVFVKDKSIAFATNHTLSINMDTKETSSKDSGGKWQTSEAGILSWSASSENLMTATGAGHTYDEMVDLMLARKPVKLTMAPEGDSANFEEGKLSKVDATGWTPSAGGRTGMALITSIEQNAPNGENATFTVQFTGVGALEKGNAAPTALSVED